MDLKLVPETFISKFETKGKLVYAKICWKQNESVLFSIQIFSDDQSWSGNFSYKEAKSFEERLHENTKDYSRNVKNALKRSSEMFKYDFVKSNEFDTNTYKSKFAWKRIFTNSTAVLIHGFVNLERDAPPESKDIIIDFLLNENKTLHNTIENLRKNNETLNNEVDKFKSEFEKLIDIKESLESTLYGKFIQLLNSKKRRIQLLEDHVNNIERDTGMLE